MKRIRPLINVAVVSVALFAAINVAFGKPTPVAAPAARQNATAQPTRTPVVALPTHPQPIVVIDGDTVASDGVQYRIIGIDTPERGECGFAEASAYAANLVSGGVGTFWTPSDDGAFQTDRYGRTLAYMVLVDGRDFGHEMIRAGYAIARYDSTDGYPWHLHEEAYRRETASARLRGDWPINACAGPAPVYTSGPTPATASAPSASSVYYANCAAVRAAGAAPLYRGEPGYRSALDRDNDGIACE